MPVFIRRLLAACVLATLVSSAVAEGKVSIVFILADDLGYGDVHALNPDSTIPTPNLDRLAREGMTLRDAHSGSAVCTPTRYGVVTGRYCWRSRMKSGVLGGSSPHLIDPDRVTVADLMKESGRRTACIGKWHLGMDLPRAGKDIDYAGRIANGPLELGFDTYFGVTASLDMPPYVYVQDDRFTEAATDTYPGSGFPNYMRKGPQAPGFDPAETLDVLAGKAVDFMESCARDEQPFFLYLPLTGPHKPVLPHERFQGATPLGPYGDFVHQVDHTVGLVLKALDRLDLADTTLVMMSSDNGSFMFRLDEASKQHGGGRGKDHVGDSGVQAYDPANHRANHIFRGTKADVWEGGHHVAFFARWPGTIQAGSHSDQTVCLTDLMATCAEVAGVSMPPDAGEDSFSLLPLFRGREEAFRRAPVVNHSAAGMFAVREGRWKLVLGNGSGGRQAPRGKPFTKPYFLYDLDADPSETQDLAAGHPEVVQRLEQWLETHRASGRTRP